MKFIIALGFALFMMTGTASASWKEGVFNTNTLETRVVRRAIPKKVVKRQRVVDRRPIGRKTSKPRYTGSGLASYYWQPQKVASGGYFNPNALTAAHKTLKFGTRVKVTNLRNGKSVIVKINDRGPYIKGRVIDLSKRAAGVIGMLNAGVVPVKMQIL